MFIDSLVETGDHFKKNIILFDLTSCLALKVAIFKNNWPTIFNLVDLLASLCDDDQLPVEDALFCIAPIMSLFQETGSDTDSCVSEPKTIGKQKIKKVINSHCKY
jgi:hypothetical protein